MRYDEPNLLGGGGVLRVGTYSTQYQVHKIIGGWWLNEEKKSEAQAKF